MEYNLALNRGTVCMINLHFDRIIMWLLVYGTLCDDIVGVECVCVQMIVTICHHLQFTLPFSLSLLHVALLYIYFWVLSFFSISEWHLNERTNNRETCNSTYKWHMWSEMNRFIIKSSSSSNKNRKGMIKFQYK